MLYRLSVNLGCCALSTQISGAPAQKTADTMKSEMATDGANDVVQAVCEFRLLRLVHSNFWCACAGNKLTEQVVRCPQMVQMICWI